MMTSRETEMETARKARTPRARRLLLLWAGVWLAETLAAPAGTAWAQRRRGEPEANPDFQGQVQGGASEPGQPVEPTPSAPPSAAEPVAEPAGAPARSPRVQSVQIGAAAAPPPPPPPTAPMETRVTVRVKDAPLATFLDTISAQAKVNFMITQGVNEQRVTAFLQNVTVREALQVLLEIKGLTYQQIGRSNTYVISKRSQGAPNTITRIYFLNHVPLIPILRQDEQGQQNQGAQNKQGLLVGQNVALGQMGAVQNGMKQGAVSDIAIVNVINSLLSRNGTVALDPRTNALIVTDIPEVFPQVESIIAELDKKAPQVMIEAQVVEINSDKLNNLGLSWGDETGSLAVFSGGSRETSFPLNLPTNLNNAHFFEATGLTTPSGIVPGKLNLNVLTVTLQALVTRSEARFLGKPKVLTLNNKKARIEITRKQATSVLSQVAGGGTQATAQQVERADTGVVLEVTPQVNKDGYIMMLVEPSYTDVVDTALRANGTVVKDPITRKASTLLRLKNGQTVVMGGLLSSKENRTVRKVPLLGYIPLVGWLFTSISNTRTNTDLVIFLTPSIVND